MATRKKSSHAKARKKTARSSDKPRCGLCGKTRNLTQTPCCGNWICDDEAEADRLAVETGSCLRNHRRYTLCAYHHGEGHPDDWRECQACRESFDTEDYVWHGTNEYNFAKLQNPPAFEPTRCAACGAVIHRGSEGYTSFGGKHWCEHCSDKMP